MNSVCFFRCGGVAPDRCAGRINNASASEITSTAITTIGTTRRILPICPLANSSGRNAMIVVMIVSVTGTATSFTPVTTARWGGSPRSMCS